MHFINIVKAQPELLFKKKWNKWALIYFNGEVPAVREQQPHLFTFAVLIRDTGLCTDCVSFLITCIKAAESWSDLCRSSLCWCCSTTRRRPPSGCFCCECSWRSSPHNWSPAPAGRHTDAVNARLRLERRAQYAHRLLTINLCVCFHADLADQGSRGGLSHPWRAGEQSSFESWAIVFPSKLTKPSRCIEESRKEHRQTSAQTGLKSWNRPKTNRVQSSATCWFSAAAAVVFVPVLQPAQQLVCTALVPLLANHSLQRAWTVLVHPQQAATLFCGWWRWLFWDRRRRGSRGKAQLPSRSLTRASPGWSPTVSGLGTAAFCLSRLWRARGVRWPGITLRGRDLLGLRGALWSLAWRRLGLCGFALCDKSRGYRNPAEMGKIHLLM